VDWLDLIRYSADSTIRSIIMGMKDRLLLRREPKSQPSPYQRSPVKKKVTPELVNARPAHLEDSYSIFDDSRQIDQIFASLRKKLFEIPTRSALRRVAERVVKLYSARAAKPRKVEATSFSNRSVITAG
jgi:hypothetical protein